MELTLKNLISYLEKKMGGDNNFSSQLRIREFEDGIGVIYLLEDLENEFNVNFETFDFRQYFLNESELNTLTWKAIFKREKRREIEEELTVQMLFDYMILHKKTS